MALKDIVRPTIERPPGITCEQYTRGEAGKRCIHYLANGSCALPDELMCREWLKANGRGKHEAPVVEDRPAPKPVARDLFGKPLPEVRPPASMPKPIAPAPPPRVTSTLTIDVDQLRGLTTEDIESFKVLNVTVLLRSEDCGDVWLVPAYTGRERQELTPEHAATIARVLSIFPGSHVVSFEKTAKTTHPQTLSAKSAPSRSAHDIQEPAPEV
jgi:hypothetical protein